ncbi:retrotransposon protein, putative, ty1-copia subclass [Tanacetum coccineum]
MMIKGGKIQKSNKKSLKAKGKGKANGKGKDKQVYIPKPKNPKPSAKEHPAKDDTCHHCKEVGHCKRNCLAYLAELIKKKKQVGTASSSDLTPPYTPQHNGVSERRNHTLLDMVQFMMNLTTPPLSFWDYALESATSILNMVLTKKVDKTPYGLCEIPMEVEGFEPPQEEEILIRRSERTRRAPNRLCLNVEAEEHSLGDLNEPTSYKAAMLDSESNKWIDAMNAEIQSMMDNMVWVLVDLPPGCKTVGSKWIFKKKTDMDGIVHTYKARLVAKGYTQLYGVDYEETFSPVADIRAIRILISIAAYYDYEIWQMDIKTAFLNGYLDEDIYMVQPEGFVDPNHPRKVCKLQRSIYGLKQASRSWNKRFDEEIKRFGFHKIMMIHFAQNLDEPCVYQKASGSNDLGEATFTPRIKIYRDRSKRFIGLGQNAYMDKILKRYKMDNSKRGYIPMQERLDLNKTQGASTPEEVKRMQNVPYASTVDMFLVYGGNPEAKLRVVCYCNARFKIDIDDMKSLTGYVFVLNGSAVD